MSRSLLLAFTIFLSLILLAAAHGGHDEDEKDNGTDAEHHDLRSKPLVLVKIWCLIIIFVGTFIAGVSPYFLKWNEGFLVLGTQFAGGVFLGTALMHFLSDANETFGDLTSKEYPFAFMLACVGFLLTMLADCVISYVLGKKWDGSNGGLEHGKSSRHATNSQSSSQVQNGTDLLSSKFSLAAASSFGDSIFDCNVPKEGLLLQLRRKRAVLGSVDRRGWANVRAKWCIGGACKRAVGRSMGGGIRAESEEGRTWVTVAMSDAFLLLVR